MPRASRARSIVASTLLAFCLTAGVTHAQQLGAFEKHADIGTVLHPGSATFDSRLDTYTLSGSGENMWFGSDNFQFVWKQMSGDLSLTADIRFVGTGGNNHRKAALLIRQSLASDAVYADVARHGDGLTSLQYRNTAGDTTHEVETAANAPERVRIEKRGAFVYVFTGDPGGALHFSGASMRVDLTGSFVVGLGVCSHDKDRIEAAIFSNVHLDPLPPASGKPVLWSTLETVKIASTDRLVAYAVPGHFEAPNWSRDGASLLINRDGTMHRFILGSDAVPTQVPTGAQVHVNNDHGLSPSGAELAISDQTSPDGESRVFVLPSTGGTPRQITPNGPSYWHGWSPDGRTLAFTGRRNGDFDIYTIPAAGGAETRLTTAPGLDDGPEYSPDGTFIYFNSVRSGRMQIWRMHPDGAAQEQFLDESSNDWFPHISPDGKWMVYLAYKPEVVGHPGGQDVELRLLSLDNKKMTVLARLFGGQGTINVPSWSPDSTRVAFVSYAMLPQ